MSIKDWAWTFGCVWVGGAIALGIWGKECIGDDARLIEALHTLIAGAVVAGTVWVLAAIAEVAREGRKG